MYNIRISIHYITVILLFLHGITPRSVTYPRLDSRFFCLRLRLCNNMCTTFCQIPIQEIGLLYRCRLVMIACPSIIWYLSCVMLRSQTLRLIYFRGERYHPERFDEIIFAYKTTTYNHIYIIINTLLSPE